MNIFFPHFDTFDVFSFIFVLVAFVIVFREIGCWYWKINERRDLLKEILEELKKKG